MNLALLTDLYQLTMGAGYDRAGLADRRACFHLFFRRSPFGGAYAIAAGLAAAVEYLRDLRFGEEEIAYLASLEGGGRRLFDDAFLARLRDDPITLDVQAMPEGTVAFPHEPLLRVEGKLWQAQLVETALLNILNFQTLVATKASRVCRAARGSDGRPEAVLEFGLRRAQGVDGALSASRAAYVGGCAATSNVLAGQRFGIPVKGTHAHAWVMSFPTERAAFEAYAEVFPHGCVFLVDTYDTLEGVRTAIEVGRELRSQGAEMVGVRLDSGDLAELSIGARRLLDEAGFPDADIVASNDLDEHRVAAIKERGGRVNVWGIGTRLATCYDQPALGGVYKLAAVQDEHGVWQPRIKLSENPIKTSIPKRQQVRRFVGEDGRFFADAIYDLASGFSERTLTDPGDPARTLDVPAGLAFEDLLVPVVEAGKPTGPLPDVHAARSRALAQLDQLPDGVADREEPTPYFAGLEGDLARARAAMVAAARGDAS